MDKSTTTHQAHGQNDHAHQDQERPQRRCICCRCNGKKTALLRFVVMQNTLCFDLRGKLPGRGYYVCAQASCLTKAFNGGFLRVAKRDARGLAENASAFIAQILVPGLKKRYTECLLAGMRSGKLLLGADSVEQAAKNDALACYVLATDASDATSKKYRSNATRKSLPCVGLFDRAYYGHLLGKSDKVVMGWLPSPLCEEFLALEAMIRNLEPQESSEVTASDKG